MKYHCQVWVGGWSLVDITVDARSKKDAERKARRYVRNICLYNTSRLL